jgi:Xaa-Pro aminopeptidase
MVPGYSHRRTELLKLLESADLDAVVVSHPPDWYYLTGFTGESGALIASRKGHALLTDGRFVAQAWQETTGIRVIRHHGDLFRATGKYLRERRYRRVGIQASQLSVAAFAELGKGIKKGCQTIRSEALVSLLRSRKDASELAQMRKAAELAGEVLRLGIKLLRPGIREFEVAAEIEYQMRKRGASGAAFPTIVAFGARAALPHARPTGKRLRKNELVVLDLGAILGHYRSDITRTVYVGRAPKRIRLWYRAVKEAQEAATVAARNGVKCGDVDAAARQVLAGYKLDRYFVHSTGHGLGLEVHEDPRVAKGQKQRLQAGNVITVEPGVYVEGVGGIRIEDDVAIHEKRTEVLTRGSRELIEL